MKMGSMGKLEDILAQGVKDGKIPHAVIFATNSDGSFTYKHTVGPHIIGESKPIAEDAEFLLASCTKLFTSIAALQIVDKGLFGLDDDVASVLPELAEQPIFQGFDKDDKPILVKRNNKLTLRHLLTHTSGLTYDMADPGLTKLQKQRGHDANTGDTVSERFSYPLVFEPGSQWLYGSSMDWAGKVIERVTDQTLEEYMKANIWGPVGAASPTFYPFDNPELKEKVPSTTVRTPEGKLILNTGPTISDGVKDCFGGHGSFGSMGDYLKVQRSILANDGKLLKPESVDLMFTPQLSPGTKKSLNEFRSTPYAAMMPGDHNPNVEVSWGIGSLIFLEDDVGRRKKGALHWAGMENTFWIIDREADLAFTFGTQVLPPGDRPTAEIIKEVESALYEMKGVKFDRKS